MKYTFELFILKEQLLPEYWSTFYKVLVSHLGTMSKFQLSFRCTDNIIRFFISCDKDISTLSNNIEGLLLRPVAGEEIITPTTDRKERFVQFVTGGNLLDLKEKYMVKKAIDLQYAVLKVRPLSAEKAVVSTNLFFKNGAGEWSRSTKFTTFLPVKLFAINFEQNNRYLKKAIPKYLNIEKSVHMLSTDNVNALLEVDTFPYFSHNYFLNLTSYEFDKHSFIIGSSGSGKSKFIGLFIDRLQRTALKMNYRIIVIDPHAALADDLIHIPNTKVINFTTESTELFAGSSGDISAAAELTTTLFKSLMGEQYSGKTDRVLRFSLYVLFTAQNMSLTNLKRFISDIDFRNQVLEHVAGFVPENILQFFGADFNEMRTKYYNEALSPLISFVDEMQLQPVMVGEGELSLAKTIQDNFLTVFSLNKVSMGEKVVKTVAGLLIQQIFLLAQARAFGQKVILIIDEVSVVQNPALASILAEARKFNLTVILTQQYFGQIEKNLRDAIFANVYNYYTFKVSEEDARALEGNLNIDLPAELIKTEHAKGHKEQDIRIKIMTELHPRECLIRVLANGQVVPAIKARTLDAPIAPQATAIDPSQLKSYPQTAVTLPKKFTESKQPMPTSAAVPKVDTHPDPIAPQQPPPAPTPAGMFNLSELLAQNSSSRLKVTNRKDT